MLAITRGRPGTAMMGWKTQLSDADIAVVADHVLTRYVLADPAMAQAGAPAQISGTKAHGGREAVRGTYADRTLRETAARRVTRVAPEAGPAPRR